MSAVAEMLVLTLPDGKTREVAPGTLGREVVASTLPPSSCTSAAMRSSSASMPPTSKRACALLPPMSSAVRGPGSAAKPANSRRAAASVVSFGLREAAHQGCCDSLNSLISLGVLAHPRGFEPLAFAFGARISSLSDMCDGLR